MQVLAWQVVAVSVDPCGRDQLEHALADGGFPVRARCCRAHRVVAACAGGVRELSRRRGARSPPTWPDFGARSREPGIAVAGPREARLGAGSRRPLPCVRKTAVRCRGLEDRPVVAVGSR